MNKTPAANPVVARKGQITIFILILVMFNGCANGFRDDAKRQREYEQERLYLDHEWHLSSLYPHLTRKWEAFSV